jgi:hypothetical protein
MKRFILAISLAVICSSASFGQSRTSGIANANNDTSASKQGKPINIQSDTQVSAQLENALDVRHAKPGDRVVMKTAQPIKQNGQTVVPKGSRLVGHVTEVTQRTKANGGSSMGIALDSLQRGSMNIPIMGSIMSVTQAASRTSASNNDVFGSDSMLSSSSSASSSSGASRGQRGGGGGLLGGVGNTVGGAVNTTSSTVGNTIGTTTGVVSNTTGAVQSTTGNTVGALRGLQVTQTGTASAQGGSTLRLSSGNLRLDRGTTFNLMLNGSVNAGNNQ